MMEVSEERFNDGGASKNSHKSHHHTFFLP
jgi:hypothetical protein